MGRYSRSRTGDHANLVQSVSVSISDFRFRSGRRPDDQIVLDAWTSRINLPDSPCVLTLVVQLPYLLLRALIYVEIGEVLMSNNIESKRFGLRD